MEQVATPHPSPLPSQGRGGFFSCRLKSVTTMIKILLAAFFSFVRIYAKSLPDTAEGAYKLCPYSRTIREWKTLGLLRRLGALAPED